MSITKSKLVLGSAVVALAAGAPLAAAATTTTLKASMTGKAEKPTAGDPDGSGKATIKITGKKVCYTVSYSKIDKPTDAHIHKGAKGKAGPVVVGLFTGGFKKSGCVTTTSAIAKAIAKSPSGYYVNLHNKKYPNGAVRGQL